VIVIDASALALALLDDGPLGDKSRTVLTNDTEWAAPAHLLTEVMSVIRGHVLGSKLSLARAGEAITTLTELTISLSDCQTLLTRIWQLRHNLTSYDAAYVALAESLDAPLVTADVRLTNSSGSTCATIAI
jgi:predicted nucleic acid-binding protein